MDESTKKLVEAVRELLLYAEPYKNAISQNPSLSAAIEAVKTAIKDVQGV